MPRLAPVTMATLSCSSTNLSCGVQSSRFKAQSGSAPALSFEPGTLNSVLAGRFGGELSVGGEATDAGGDVAGGETGFGGEVGHALGGDLAGEAVEGDDQGHARAVVEDGGADVDEGDGDRETLGGSVLGRQLGQAADLPDVGADFRRRARVQADRGGAIEPGGELGQAGVGVAGDADAEGVAAPARPPQRLEVVAALLLG